MVPLRDCGIRWSRVKSEALASSEEWQYSHSKFSFFFWGKDIGFLTLDKYFETGLKVIREFKEVKSSHFLDANADFDPKRGLYHCLSNHT